MAKRRRRATSGKRAARRSASGGTWKKSKAAAGILVFAIVCVWIWIFSWLFGSPAPTYENFPWTYIAEGEGEEVLILRADSDQKKRAPFQKDGKIYWDAYQCNNPDCPGRGEDGKPYVFPHVIPFQKKRLEEGKPPELTPEEMREMEESGDMMMMEEMMFAEPFCPLCDRARLDPYNVQPYDTPEGKKMKQEVMKRYRKEREKGKD